MELMWPTPKGTDADRGGRGDLLQAVRGNPSPSGHFRSPSEASSQGSADSTSASNEPVCELCGSASRTPTASGSSPGTGPASRVTPTCAPLWPTPQTAYDGRTLEAWRDFKQRAKERHAAGLYAKGTGAPGLVDLQRAIQLEAMGERCPCRCHTSTSSPADSPAKTSPTPAAAPESTGHARVFGPSSPDSFANYDPGTCSWRTSQLSLLEEWAEFSQTWPRAGMTRNGTAYRLAPSAPLTDATESGSWPTPTARDHKDTGDLTGVPENGLLPRVVDRMEEQCTGSLNPTWVEWLMGYPTGWTDSEPSATASSPRSPNSSAAGSSNGSAHDDAR